MSIHNELKMAERLIRNLSSSSCSSSSWWLQGYRLVAREWCVVDGRSDLGKGDLVFYSNEHRKFLVMELKYLDPRPGRTARTRRTHARKFAQEQAERYGKAWAAKHPGRRVDACVYFGGGGEGAEGPPKIWTVQEEKEESPRISGWNFKSRDESSKTSGRGSKVQDESSLSGGISGWGFFLGMGIGLLGVAAAVGYVLAGYNNKKIQRKEEEEKKETDKTRRKSK